MPVENIKEIHSLILKPNAKEHKLLYKIFIIHE